MIQHNSYEDGKVQSLKSDRFRIDGRVASMGLMMPGQYSFGTAAQREEIHVINGVLRNDQGVQHIPGGGPLVFEQGEKISFACDDMVGYLCIYG